MSRRLLGYVVKLPDGTRSPRTPKPVPLADIVAPWGDGEAAEPYAVVPVFATRKPKPAPLANGKAPAAIYVVTSIADGVFTTTMTAFEDAAERDRAAMAADGETTSRVLRYVPEPKPAPVVAAEGLPPLFVVLHGYRGSFDQLYIGGSVVVTDQRAEAERRASEWRGDGAATACQVFAAGAHEAAVEAARREERARVLAEVEFYAARAAKRNAQADPHSWAGGRSGAFAEIAEAVRTMGEEKGQAK